MLLVPHTVNADGVRSTLIQLLVSIKRNIFSNILDSSLHTDTLISFIITAILISIV